MSFYIGCTVPHVRAVHPSSHIPHVSRIAGVQHRAAPTLATVAYVPGRTMAEPCRQANTLHRGMAAVRVGVLTIDDVLICVTTSYKAAHEARMQYSVWHVCSTAWVTHAVVHVVHSSLQLCSFARARLRPPPVRIHHHPKTVLNAISEPACPPDLDALFPLGSVLSASVRRSIRRCSGRMHACMVLKEPGSLYAAGQPVSGLVAGAFMPSQESHCLGIRVHVSSHMAIPMPA